MVMCPNCGAVNYMGFGQTCRCTWDEQQKAVEILRRHDVERRQRGGRPTVVECEAAKLAGSE